MRHPFGLRIANILLSGASIGGVGAAVHFWIRPLGEGPKSAVFAILAGLISLSLLAVASVAIFLAIRGGEGTRVIQTVLSLCLLLTFPIGTLYAAYTLWACWSGKSSDSKTGLRWPDKSASNQAFRFVPR